MYLITEKNENRILNYGKKLDYLENGYPRLIEENIAFPTEMVNVYEVEKLEEGVEPEKYCYTSEKGFYKNENYVRYYTEEERLEMVESVIDELLLGGLN